MKESEGARLLAESGDSIRQIAEKIGVAKEMARLWRTGAKLPSAENREALQKAYGIPVKAWDKTPAGKGKKAATKKPATTSKASPEVARPKTSAKVATKVAAPVATSTGKAVATASPPVATDDVDAERRLREQLARLDEMRRDPTVTPAALIQIERIETQALRELGRITGEISAISEETIIRHPAFKRVMDAILAALDRHPKALADVEAALAAIDG